MVIVIIQGMIAGSSAKELMFYKNFHVNYQQVNILLEHNKVYIDLLVYMAVCLCHNKYCQLVD